MLLGRPVAVFTLVTLLALDACHVHGAPEPSSAGAGATSVASSASATAPLAASASASTSASTGEALTVRDVPFPPGSGPASFDLVAYEPAHDRVWVPGARDVGAVDVYDVARGTFTRIAGFARAELVADGKARVLGPSSAAIGAGVVYVGNRATHEVCPIDAGTLAIGACFKLPHPIDAVVYVPSVKELWVTMPHDRTLAVLDAAQPSALKAKTEIVVAGAPEGSAFDEARGVFFTNLEDVNRTVAIDLAKHTVIATFGSGCDADGPRGLAIDPALSRLIVACTDRVRVLDLAKKEALLAELETGAGVDHVDYVAARKLLYVAAGKAGRLTIARLDDGGALAVVATVVTAPRARNAVVDVAGSVYLVDPAAPRLLIVSPKP